MRATEILSAEHRVILRVLECLDRLRAEALQRGRLDAGAARDALEFFGTFADACHHAKEEGQLFPRLEAHGLPRDGGPVGVMLHEHELGRGLRRQMAEALDGAAAGRRDALEAFCRGAQDFHGLLRDHIAKEDNILFRIADQVLPPAAQEEVLRGFESAEHERGAGTHERMLQVADALCWRCGVQGDVAAPTPACFHP